ARSGVAAAELLARRGAQVTVSEQGPAIAEAGRLRAAGVALETGGHLPETFAAADLLVLSPGVPAAQPAIAAARARGVEVIGELELAFRFLRGPVVAITGTKGKSTTATLIGRMLQAAGRDVLVGGNIGVPLSAQVDRSRPGVVHVVEVSSFQLETTVTFRPWIAVWLNLTPDHLDRHESFEAYGAAKARLFERQTGDDWAVLNGDDAEVMARTADVRSRVATFRMAGGRSSSQNAGDDRRDVTVEAGWIVRRTTTGDVPLVPAEAVELHGRHMFNNVLAAAAAADVAGVSAASMAEALRGFRGLEHVMEPVGAIGGVQFVNDSKATNVDAACRSIESFDRVVAVVGGRFKGGDLGELREPLRRHGRAVVAIGESAARVAAALDGVVPVVTAGSMREAVERGHAAAQPDGVVLLAPACASQDWFTDYAERGRVFKDEVLRLRRKTEEAAR
ncbi:MAG: UDP-N-acetylmuramoyl-L-alanine--D-glutamate ligase, partial [Acidimicrobiia bacterium]|nr:UDP-N-acetylmuramoyl-L-alanine--D-glutamate ligase [Acidimicrobiia bacterium]